MQTTPSNHNQPRDGTTVVEVLVALILLTVGLMGVAGSSALALRTALDATHRRGATQRASTRIAQIAAAGCTTASSGASVDSVSRISEQWRIVAQANGVATVSDSVEWVSATGWKAFALVGVIPC